MSHMYVSVYGHTCSIPVYSLVSWGLAMLLRQGVVFLYGPGSFSVAAPYLGAVLVAVSPYPVYRLVVMAISLAAIAGTFMLFFRTRFGDRKSTSMNSSH